MKALDSKIKGNASFMSKNQIQFKGIHSLTLEIIIGISRRDDLESLMYSLIFLRDGKLPWPISALLT